MQEPWIEVCDSNDIEEEDVIRFDYGSVTLAVYRSDKNAFYATNGYCTHERVHLSDGLVMGNIIECPKHNGRFDYTTGQAKKTPACDALQTYPVKVTGGKVYVRIE
ncbi:MocE family 2Fe-2S type ferredoxin [Paenibacillus glycanilyticus]|uniref:Rieske family ferredoxin n=1 Tax=Paenibacillus glycanilyticus TaxID=126569 RepID=A0ABQ6GBP6_9BACL|nr:MocE family 2Fe-2S type ferredoxin [Paenibacillus glycanilyticus]GLX67011.1 Rieske family ferredoxin [Paenibacillus glycanilyticus]